MQKSIEDLQFHAARNLLLRGSAGRKDDLALRFGSSLTFDRIEPAIMDFQEGDGGNDTLIGAAGEYASLYGYGGDDVLIGSNYFDPTIPFFGPGGEGLNGDFLVGGKGSDTILGGDGDDYVFGPDFDLVDGGDNLVDGGAGNDFLRGGDGVDTILGGDGFDRISFFGPVGAYTGPVDIDLRTQTVFNDGFGNQDIISGIESLSAGTPFADRLLGDDGDNYFGGGGQGDTMIGFGGDDRFQVGGQMGVLDGGDGYDMLVLTDSVVTPTGNLTGTNNMRVDLQFETVYDDGFGNSYAVTGIEAVYASTTARAILSGNAADNEIGGAGGNDKLYGRDGADSLFGYEGRDRLFGQNDDDVLEGGAHNDKLYGQAGNDTLDGGVDDDDLDGGFDNDQLSGGDGNDRLFASDGDDVLDGGAGSDKLYGDAGNDTMTGGDGVDRFFFRDDFGIDEIADFTSGVDLMNLVDQRGANGGQPLSFDQLLITQQGGDAWIELDLDRNGTADTIDLDGDGTLDTVRIELISFDSTTLTAADFVF